MINETASGNGCLINPRLSASFPDSLQKVYPAGKNPAAQPERHLAASPALCGLSGSSLRMGRIAPVWEWGAARRRKMGETPHSRLGGTQCSPSFPLPHTSYWRRCRVAVAFSVCFSDSKASRSQRPSHFPAVPGPTADETKIDSANQPMCRSVVEDGIRDSVSVLGRRHARVA